MDDTRAPGHDRQAEQASAHDSQALPGLPRIEVRAVSAGGDSQVALTTEERGYVAALLCIMRF